MAFAVFAVSPLPTEDASMLFRYAQNLANGYGIVFNPGQSPVDGATDLFFMIMIGGLHALGVPIATAAGLVNAIGLGVMASLVVWAWKYWALLRPPWLFLPLALLLVGPVWLYGSQGFATLTFAAACSGVAFMSECVARNPRDRSLIGLGLLVVLAGLIRPEGFILGSLIVVAQAWRTRSFRALWLPGALVIGLGLTFVAVRWNYFGYPFPNPFYKKSGGQLHLVGLRSTAAVLTRAALPVCILLVLGLTNRRARRRALSLSFVIVGWASAWLLISDEMNLFGRFQFAIVPVLLVLTAPLYREYAQPQRSSAPSRGHRLALTVIAAAGIAVAVVAYLIPTARFVLPRMVSPASARSASIHYQVAEVLNRHADNGNRELATTEAGYVGWKSGWTVTDLWGLNDKEIAHGGYLDVGELTTLDPEIVFAHFPSNNLSDDSHEYSEALLPGWDSMTDPLLCFVHEKGYELIGHWGQTDSFVVLARPDLPDLGALRQEFGQVSMGETPNTASAGELPTPTTCSG